MTTLEDDLDYILELDFMRRQAEDLLERSKSWIQSSQTSDNKWEKCEDPIEFALLIRAIKGEEAKKLEEAYIEQLIKLSHERLTKAFRQAEAPTIEEDLDGLLGRGDITPVFAAARVLQALVRNPKYAFSKTALLCYYVIIREIYSSASPDWSTGGARAGNGGRPTAFITGECIRAISAFEQTLRNTANLFSELQILHEKSRALPDFSLTQDWRKSEWRRLLIAWHTKVDIARNPIALDLAIPPLDSELKNSDEIVHSIMKSLPSAFEESLSSFREALEETKLWRDKEEERGSANPTFLMSEGPHKMGQLIIGKAIANAEAALGLVHSARGNLEILQDLSVLFLKIRSEVHKISEPALRFVSAVLDRELAASAIGTASALDVPELIFAAASYGARKNWQEERLERACLLLADRITEKGEFPTGRPFYSTRFGYRLNPVAFEVARACAQIFGNTESPLEARLARRLLQLFVRYQVEVTGTLGKEIGWTFETSPAQAKPCIWATAVAILALRKYIRMLDKVINRVVLRHFGVINNQESEIRLSQLIHSDWGLSLAPAKLEPKIRSGLLLEQLRIHVQDATLPATLPDDKYFAVLLYGPPGTGKTSLCEALALSCGVPLLRISPGDFAVGGEAAVERRARAIFSALSTLTKVVIAFDEFEPVIRARSEDDNLSKNDDFLRSFLTPAMLPKLSNLYRRAQHQSIVYFVITNHKNRLDEAAIRPGRVDIPLEILNPDPLSRAVAILRLIGTRFITDSANEMADRIARVETAVRLTSGLTTGAFATTLRFKDLGDAIVLGNEKFDDYRNHLVDIQAKSKASNNQALQAPSGETPTRRTDLQNWLTKWEANLEAPSGVWKPPCAD